MNQRDTVVRCRRLTKSYGAGEGAVVALRGVDLDLRTGELLMLLGPSGCGKTTLISIMTGILGQDDGDCAVLGQDLRRMTEAQRARLRRDSIGFVFQAFNLLPGLTALENVAVPLIIRGVPHAAAAQRAGDMLAALGLRSRADAAPSRLSGGEQQRVAIARALVHQPALVVCDEPTSNLDTQTGHDMMGVLRGLGSACERALIVVTHDTRILDFADRVARMEDGRIVNDGVTAGDAGVSS